MIRVGIGYDIHRLAEGRKLILGGVEIPHEKGLLGHSDADVLIHSICDALLGSLALGDIGQHFPDTDPRYKDVSSLSLLKQVAAMVTKEGYEVWNLDSTIVAQNPRLASYIVAMRKNIMASLGVEMSRISIKAKTPEGLGPLGEEKGIAAYAICSVKAVM
ncbi:MAG: 2-C-methyl-D-erythritol 2,4-cyclodiphosphate synthase [Candidatus Tectomicrobia bacterium]|nr:2-C-methyl-D-erythritol 2,4-cyclodiphosphate synthase [Candidatus Tectomicrobia bacterium]